MKRTVRRMVMLVPVLLLVFIMACAPLPKEITPAPKPTPTPTPTPTGGQGTIEIRVTDPPPPGVTSANVTLTKLEVHRASDSDNESGWITIIEGEVTFDLFEVIDQVLVLGSANVTAGKYTQIRMDVTGVEGLTKAMEPYQATVPGDKLRIVRPFDVEDGGTTALTLDFDGDKSLVATGQGKFLFKPVVKLLVEHSSPPATGGEVGKSEGKGKPEEQKFLGTVDNITGTTWIMTIRGQSRTVDVSGAEIEGEPAVGLEAEVEGTVVNNTIVASEVEIKETE